MERFTIEVTQGNYGVFNIYFRQIKHDRARRILFGYVSYEDGGRYQARDYRNSVQAMGNTVEEAVEHLLSSMIVVKRGQ